MSGAAWIAAAVVGAASLVSMSTASAAPENMGSLVVTPAAGDLDSAIDLLTDGECTRGTTFVVTMDGRGLSQSRGNLVGATKIDSLGVPRYPGFHEVPVSATMREYLLRSLDRPRLAGDYTLTFVCRNTLDTEPLQVFTGEITVAGDGTYKAVGDSARDVRDVVGAEVYDRVAEGERISREAEANDPAPEPGAVEPEGPPVAVSEPEAPADPLGWLRPVLIVVGVVLLGAVAMSWARSRGREEGRRAAQEAAGPSSDSGGDQERAGTSA